MVAEQKMNDIHFWEWVVVLGIPAFLVLTGWAVYSWLT